MGYLAVTGGVIGKLAVMAMSIPAPIAQQDAVAPAPVLVDLSRGFEIGSSELRRSGDGLFYLNARVNGVPVRFLVDTGASMIVLTQADASRVGVAAPTAAFNETAETAGGRSAMARVKLDHMSAGPAEGRNIDAAVAGEGLGVSLLGQSWLARLNSVTIRGEWMVLQ